MANRRRAVEDLEYIRRVIEEARRATVESNPLFFLWGGVTWAAVLLTYAFVFVTRNLQGPNLLPYVGWVWWVLTGAAALYTVGYMILKRRRNPLSTLSVRILRSVWQSCLIGILLLVYGGALAARLHGYELSVALLLATVTVLLAFAFFVMGGVYELPALRRLGPAFWAGAALMLLLPSDWAPLLYGLVVGTGFLLTGTLLHRQGQRRSSGSAHREQGLGV